MCLEEHFYQEFPGGPELLSFSVTTVIIILALTLLAKLSMSPREFMKYRVLRCTPKTA